MVDNLLANPAFAFGASLLAEPNLGRALGQGANLLQQGQQQQLQRQQQQAELDRQQQLRDAISSLATERDIDPREALINPRSVLSTGGVDSPSAVREFQFFQGLSPEEQAAFLGVKRAQQTVGLGGTIGVLDPRGGGLSQEFAVTPKITETPAFKEEVKAAEVVGVARGEVKASLASMRSKLPQLRNTVAKLSALGKKATFTVAGRAADETLRQIGQSTPGGVARAEYLSIVDNQVLPLLKDTFGAAFTEREGQTLRNTLGDPNMTPEEKDAALNAFIEQKIASVEAAESQLKELEGVAQTVDDISAMSDEDILNQLRVK